MIKVFAENLPMGGKSINGASISKNKINWGKCIGEKIKFINNDIEGELEVLDYYVKNKQPIVRLRYNDIESDVVGSNLIKGKLKTFFGEITGDFKIEIGTRFQDEKRDITIIDRKIEKRKHGKSIVNEKLYKYRCNKCGYEEFKCECSLLKETGCPVCCTPPRIVVEHINSIVKTDSWMIPYFQGGYDEAKLYTKTSNKKIYPICPDCGRIKDKPMLISNINKIHSIGCTCSDKISFPEKSMINILHQLNIKFIYQLGKFNLKWCNKYKYDFYFKLDGEEYIIETHGQQHYIKSFETCGGDSVEKVQANDKIKKELALANGIKEENYIVIDCRKSEIDWIRNNKDGILNSKLSEMFELNKIDWEKCFKFILTSLVKEIYEYKKKNPDMKNSEIATNMNLHTYTINNYLKRGYAIWGYK